MSLLIGFLTFILVVNCLFLMLLVLVQLPKKEAGAGLAFGAGAVDTLIGAGSGNALTKMTKYSAGIFLALAVVIAILNTQRHQGSASYLKEELSKRTTTPAAAPIMPAQQPAAAPASGSLPAPAGNQVSPANTPPNQNPTPTFQIAPQPTPEQGATPNAAAPNTAAPASSQTDRRTSPDINRVDQPNTAPANTGTKTP